jgi:uncharacterized repeat protein (TIGR01451 family)
MNRAMAISVLAALLSLASTGIAASARAEEPAPPATVVWQGDVEVNQSVIFSANQTLVILPGTTVRIRTVAPSCTEGSAPVITVSGDLVARGNDTARIRFISVAPDGTVCTAGREALLVYSGPTARNQSISHADFAGGTLLCYQAALVLDHCRFNGTQVRFSGDNSTIEDCAFLDSPLAIFPRSATVISDCTFGRTGQDDSGIYLYDSATVQNCTISDCVSGIEASIWITGSVTGNTITGCLEAINSTGALDITGNVLTGNGVGVRSWAGLDRVEHNIIGGNDVGIASLGRLSGAANNTFQAPGGASNRQADVRELLLASGGCVDGNGQPLKAPVTIRDSSGRTVFSGYPDFVALTAYERYSNGSERRYGPFSASAALLGASNSTTLDGSYNVSFTLRLELLPELVLQSFHGPVADAAEGDQVPLTITVRNTGPVPARGFRVAAFVDGEQAYIQQVNSLGPGEARNLTFEWTASPGKHTFKATADSSMTVAEPSEKDNSRSFGSEVRPAVFVPSRPMLLSSVILIVAGTVLVTALRRKS